MTEKPKNGCNDCGTMAANHFYRQVGADGSLGLVCGECRTSMLKGPSRKEKVREAYNVAKLAPFVRRQKKADKQIAKVKSRERLDIIRWERHIREEKENEAVSKAIA